MECDFFIHTWNLVFCWLSFFTVLLADINSSALQFGGSHAFRKDIRLSFQVIWLACIWAIWKECNSIIFRFMQVTLDQLLEHIKFHSWWSLKTYVRKHIKHYFDFHSGWLKHWLCYFVMATISDRFFILYLIHCSFSY